MRGVWKHPNNKSGQRESRSLASEGQGAWGGAGPDPPQWVTGKQADKSETSEHKALWHDQKDSCSISKAMWSYFKFSKQRNRRVRLWGDLSSGICWVASSTGKGLREEGWTKVEQEVGMEGRGCTWKAFWRSGRSWWLMENSFLIILFLQWPISDATDSGRPSINPSPWSVVAMGQALCKGLKDQIESLPDTYPSPPPSHPSTRLCTPEIHRASQICTMGLIRTVSERHLITALRLSKEVIIPG